MTRQATLFERVSEDVQAAIEAGASLADAAREAGCSPRTVERWLARGRADLHGPYGPFTDAVDYARGMQDLEDARETLDPDEHKALVTKAARAGSVPAMRLWWQMEKHEKESRRAASEDTLNPLDELARLRRVREMSA